MGKELVGRIPEILIVLAPARPALHPGRFAHPGDQIDQVGVEPTRADRRSGVVHEVETVAARSIEEDQILLSATYPCHTPDALGLVGLRATYQAAHASHQVGAQQRVAGAGRLTRSNAAQNLDTFNRIANGKAVPLPELQQFCIERRVKRDWRNIPTPP